LLGSDGLGGPSFTSKYRDAVPGLTAHLKPRRSRSQGKPVPAGRVSRNAHWGGSTPGRLGPIAIRLPRRHSNERRRSDPANPFVALRSSRCDGGAVKSNRLVNRRSASEAIVRFDYGESGRGPVAVDEVVLLDDAFSCYGTAAAAPCNRSQVWPGRPCGRRPRSLARDRAAAGGVQ
jgi:hypothetical protein